MVGDLWLKFQVCIVVDYVDMQFSNFKIEYLCEKQKRSRNLFSLFLWGPGNVDCLFSKKIEVKHLVTLSL